MISNQMQLSQKNLKYMSSAILALLLSACGVIHDTVQTTEFATVTPPASAVISTNIPVIPTFQVSTPAVEHIATPTIGITLPTANRPISEALFAILSDDQTKLLAAYDGASHFQVLYEIPPELGRVQVVFYPAAFPTISRDGKWAVVIENKKTGRSNVDVVDLVSRKATPILTWIGPQFEATISPDGKRVAFLSSEGECSGDREYAVRFWCNTRHLYVMDADGSNIERLTTRPANRCFPTWSPTATRLAYQEGCNPADASQIYLITFSDGGAAKTTQVTKDGAMPSWSPDARWLRWGSTTSNVDYVGLLNTSGDVVSQFNLGTIIGVSDIAWSPDSRQMARAIKVGGETRIRIWDLGSSVRVREKDFLTPGVSVGERLRWLFDGKRFAFSGDKLDSNQKQVKSWFIIDSEGTHLIEVNAQ